MNNQMLISNSETINNLLNSAAFYNEHSTRVFVPIKIDYPINNLHSLSPYSSQAFLPIKKIKKGTPAYRLKKFLGAWKGNDNQEMLDLVYLTRSKF